MEPISELERIKNELTRLFSTDTLGRSINWDWEKDYQRCTLEQFKLIAKNYLCKPQLEKSILELIDKYQALSNQK